MALLTSCVDGPVENQPVTAARVARAFAIALGDPGVRADLRNALRASPFVEHKVKLSEFLQSGAGQRMRQHASLALGSDRDLMALVSQLPPMTIAMPNQQHRRTWSASGEVALAITLNNDLTPADAFDARGQSVAFRLAETPVLLLEPAEKMMRRAFLEAATAGSVIEDSGEVAYGATLRSYDARGRLIREIDFSTMPRPTRDGANDGGFRVGEPDTTRLTRFFTQEGDGAGGLELLFTARLYNSLGQLLQTDAYDWTNCYSCPYENHEYLWSYPYQKIIHRRVVDSSGSVITVQITEDDWIYDDNYGWVGFGWQDNNVNKALTSYDKGPSEVRLTWTPKQPVSGNPNPTLPAVTGPATVAPYAWHTWYASNISGGTGGYSYQWYVNGQFAGTGSSYSGNFSQPQAAYDLTVEVYDGDGLLAYSPILQVITTAGCDPNDPECEESIRASPRTSPEQRGKKPPTVPIPRSGRTRPKP